MKKIEAVVDTCFLQKLSSEGKNPENIKKILSELNYIPVAHPYLIQHELSLFSYFNQMIKEGYIHQVSYSDFLKDNYDRQQYEAYFSLLYEDMRLALEARDGTKKISPLELKKGQTIYNTHRQGSSLGDVHLMLMASFLHMPLILTEDSDIELLRSIARRRMSIGTYTLQIYNALDLLKRVAEKTDSSISKNELLQILNEIKERAHRSEIKTIWNEHHSQ